MSAGAPLVLSRDKVPCKYFAAGFCINFGQNKRCIERVGGAATGKSFGRNRTRIVEKRHVETDALEWERIWLESGPRVIVEDFTEADAESAKGGSFRYAAVIDVEGKDGVIEFPAIVLDLWRGTEVFRFHRWVRPVGLQERIDAGLCGSNPRSPAVSLGDVVSAFMRELCEEHGIRQEDVLPVHCGDFDANALKRELKEGLPWLFTRWCNLKDLCFDFEMKKRYGGKLPDFSQHGHAPVKLAFKLGGMNRMAGFFHTPPVPGDDPELHHLGMYDTTKIAFTLLWVLFRAEKTVKFLAHGRRDNDRTDTDHTDDLVFRFRATNCVSAFAQRDSVRHARESREDADRSDADPQPVSLDLGEQHYRYFDFQPDGHYVCQARANELIRKSVGGSLFAPVEDFFDEAALRTVAALAPPDADRVLENLKMSWEQYGDQVEPTGRQKWIGRNLQLWKKKLGVKAGERGLSGLEGLDAREFYD